MKVKFLTSMAGTNFVHYQGEVKEIDDKEAKALIIAEICEPFIEETKKGKRPRINIRTNEL